MNRVIRTLVLMSVLVVVSGFFLSIVADRAIAQVRAALVKNIDEPGRMPYQQLVQFSTSECVSVLFCIVSFNPVPAGKRLVVEHVSMLVFVQDGGQPNLLAFGDGFSTNTGNVAILENDFKVGRSVLGQTAWSFSRPDRVYYEAGQTPKVKVGASAAFGFDGNASLHGYLIDATN